MNRLAQAEAEQRDAIAALAQLLTVATRRRLDADERRDAADLLHTLDGFGVLTDDVLDRIATGRGEG